MLMKRIFALAALCLTLAVPAQAQMGSSVFSGAPFTAPAACTATLLFGGGSTGMSLSQTCRYTITNSTVNVWIHLSLTTKGSSTGNASIGGLPVASVTGTASCAVVGNALAVGTVTNLEAEIAPATSAITPYAYAAGNVTQLAETNFANGSVFDVSCSYPSG